MEVIWHFDELNDKWKYVLGLSNTHLGLRY